MDNTQNEKYAKLIEQIKEIEAEIDEIVVERDALAEEAMHKTTDQTNPIAWMQVKANYEEIIKLHERKRMLERRWRDVSLAIVKGYKKDKKDNLSYRLKSGAVVRLKGLPRLSGKIIKAIGSRTARIGKSGIDKLKRKFGGFNLDEVINNAEQKLEKFDGKSGNTKETIEKLDKLLDGVENGIPIAENGLIDYSKIPEDRLKIYCDYVAERDKALAKAFSNCLKIATSRYRNMISKALKEYQVDSAEKGEIAFDFKDGNDIYLAKKPEDLELLFEKKLRPTYEAKATYSQATELVDPSRRLPAGRLKIEDIKPKSLADLSPEKQKMFKDKLAAMQMAKAEEPVTLTDSQQAYAKYLETGDELHPAMSHDEAVKYVQDNPEKVEELAQKHQAQKSLPEKKQLLLSKYSDLINQRVLDIEARGKHFGSLKPDLQAEYTDNYLTNLIRVGEEKYGDNFIEDIMNEPTEEPIKWLMDEVSKEEDMTAEPIIPDYSFMEPQPVEPIVVEPTNEETITTKAEKEAISTIAQDRENAGTLTESQSLHDDISSPTPVDENPNVANSTETEEVEPLDVEIPNAQEIAQDLTPNMLEHYRSIAELSPHDTREYKNAAAILKAYDNLQMEADKQAAIDQLHAGDRVR